MDASDAGTCGNGVVDPGEQCDGKDLGGQSCTSLGHTGGTLSCGDGCVLDQTACFDYPANWYDVAWHHRRTVTIHAAQVVGSLTDFPVALVVNDNTVLAKLQAGGQDVLITAADGKTKLSHEIELLDVAGGSLVIWTRVPVLSSAADTTLYLYYGNATCADQQDAVHVWDASEQGVWHLGELATAGGSGVVHHDATGHAHDGGQHGNGDAQGKLGRGQSFDGVSNYIDVAGASGVVIGAADCTVSAWVRTSAPSPMGLVVKTSGTTMTYGTDDKVFGISTGHQIGFQAFGGQGAIAGAAINDGAWHHVAWTQAASAPATWTLYVDGVPVVAPTPPVTLVADNPTHVLRFGAVVLASNLATAYFNGTMDEVHISSSARSAAWIQTSVHDQGSPSTFYALGAEEGALP